MHSESTMFGDFMANLFEVCAPVMGLIVGQTALINLSVLTSCVFLSQLHGRPVLGLNCVGGKSADVLMKHLA